MNRISAITCLSLLVIASLLPQPVLGQALESQFKSPPQSVHPETWFHLIGGNVNKSALTTDLEAVAKAGFQGIQLFHGKGSPWPEVSPQIETLSAPWDDMISHVGDETTRLGLRFTMQNCPGWAMSGGPWITPDKAMRHLISSRTTVQGGQPVSLQLARPQPSDEPWRDYRDVAVIAFPTPLDDSGEDLKPIAVDSNRDASGWMALWKQASPKPVTIDPGEDPTWLELSFAEPTHLRSIELPPVELLMKRRNFDPATRIELDAFVEGQWQAVAKRDIPRGNWQDRQPEHPLVLAFPDTRSTRFRLTFVSQHPLELSYLRLFATARIHDWRGQAGYALRSLDRSAPPVQDPASWIASDSIVDLSERLQAGGQMRWNAPPGDWTILRFGHVNTGVKNKPAPPEATGFECDKLSTAGADQHFAGYIGRITAAGGPADGQLKGMLIDSWECYTQTWTPSMEREFAARCGYELRSWFPTLAGYVVEDHETSERFLRDWRKTISDMLVQNYFGRLAELARQRGLRLSFETALGDVSPGDILEYFKSADTPMCEFWQPNDPHQGGLETKPILPAVSAAHLYGKQTIAAEAFTNIGLRWDEHPYRLKHMADRHFTYGINHLIFHTYTHNPRTDVVPGTSFGGRIGTPFLRGQTWWQQMPRFTDYIARCELMLRQGNPVASVLRYLGDDVDHKPRQDAPFPIGYKQDYLNADALHHRISVREGELVSPEGIRWRVIWLPTEECKRLTTATLKRLHELISQGAIVIGNPPESSPTLRDASPLRDAEGKQDDFDSWVRRLWGDANAKTGDRTVGAGRLLWSPQIGSTQNEAASFQELLLRLEIPPDVLGTLDATWCHRQTETSEIYFLAANRARGLDRNVQFSAVGRPEWWDPMTGETTKIEVYQQTSSHTTIPLHLPAAGSLFVVFQNSKKQPVATRIEHDDDVVVDAKTPVDSSPPTNEFPFGLQPGDELQPWVDPPSPQPRVLDEHHLLVWEDGQYRVVCDDKPLLTTKVSGLRVREVAGPWKLDFPAGWDTPTQVAIEGVKPWSTLDDPTARAFSGSAMYRAPLNVEASELGRPLQLDLGQVHVIAEVSINGKQVGTLWAPPFRMDIAAHVHEGENVLQVTVTNPWHNRLVFDANLPAEERKTWTYQAPDKNASLLPAGLSGPVVVRVGQVVEF
ncbi:glycosyl hydrolase [Novipirellula artificiosorum]|uniref:Glycosyl hydrolases family 2, sugar binding domain n=1 Tax=Novipirellula artificiosorum TaxID=2528016 RepID=A0A5C6DHC0_9BACT|nr:glycosyl hydrolase [Novipirellula artificiosorum]TWU34349.1 Glycosyl hydrolases family 2, sugar binding domain [Novipirellula artificiosorum]